jgi:hypothetical protein
MCPHQSPSFEQCRHCLWEAWSTSPTEERALKLSELASPKEALEFLQQVVGMLPASYALAEVQALIMFRMGHEPEEVIEALCMPLPTTPYSVSAAIRDLVEQIPSGPERIALERAGKARVQAMESLSQTRLPKLSETSQTRLPKLSDVSQTRLPKLEAGQDLEPSLSSFPKLKQQSAEEQGRQLLQAELERRKAPDPASPLFDLHLLKQGLVGGVAGGLVGVCLELAVGNLWVHGLLAGVLVGVISSVVGGVFR